VKREREREREGSQESPELIWLIDANYFAICPSEREHRKARKR